MEHPEKKSTQFAILILAAGKGTRLKSRRAKVLHEIAGKTLLRHVADAARQIVLPHDIYVIVGYQADQVRAALAGLNVHFIHQAEQRGTAHAVRQAKKMVQRYDNLIVLSGDAPLIRPEAIAHLRDFHLAANAAMTILTAAPENPSGYGRVLRDREHPERVQAIVEQKDLTAELSHVREINSGIYTFSREKLYDHIDQIDAGNAQGELYLTDMAEILNRAGELVVGLAAQDADEVLGANTIAEMMELDGKLRLRNAQRLMAEGVTIFRPETTVIDSEVTVGPDTVIEPFVQLLGTTRIGEECRIRSYAVIESATLGNKVLVRNGCLISHAHIQDGAFIGPYAHIRPESEIGEEAHVGNFVEVKKTRLGKGSKANHLTYLGDAEIGAAVNIGAGVITCNYDGNVKTRTVIGDGAFVGSDSTLVAPIALGAGSYVAAGSCITEDVPEDALALGRSRQTIKAGWARTRPRKN